MPTCIVTHVSPTSPLHTPPAYVPPLPVSFYARILMSSIPPPATQSQCQRTRHMHCTEPRFEVYNCYLFMVTITKTHPSITTTRNHPAKRTILAQACGETNNLTYQLQWWINRSLINDGNHFFFSSLITLVVHTLAGTFRGWFVIEVSIEGWISSHS